MFTNNNEETADRLVLELANGRDGGGWCFSAVVRQSADELKSYSNHDLLSSKDIQTISEQIAKRLFTNNNEETADRLVLELANGRDGGGWFFSAVVRQSADELKSY